MKRNQMNIRQSLIVYGNPYRDDANVFMNTLNMLWNARQLIDTKKVNPLIVAEIDDQIRVCIQYLEQHKTARPYEFSKTFGYRWKQLENWEGRDNYYV